MASFAQDGVSIGNWRTHLPFQKVTAVEPVGTKIYAATDFELFYYDTEDNSINILNRINGLSDIGISTMRYNESQRKLLVAYTNANIDLINADGSIKNMSDIKGKNIGGNKSINNIFFDADLAYLACGFGIVVLDLKKEEVKDTYYIGNQGSMVNVTDVAFYDGRIYASTDNGVYSALQNAPNLANYAAWQFDTSLVHPHQPYTEMEVFGGKLLLNYDGGFNADTLFVFDGSQWTHFDREYVAQKYELRAYDDRLLIANRYNVNVFDQNLNETMNIYSPGGIGIEPLSAAIDQRGNYWIGDTKRGLVGTTDGWNKTDVLPNGPASKNAFHMQATGNQVWVATGGYASNWSKRYIKEGVARFDGIWTAFTSSNIQDLDAFSDFICTATNPNDPSVTYVGTWGYGVLKLKDGQLEEVYNADNSSLSEWTSDPNFINISGLGFDSKGNLWVANTGASHLLSVMKPDGTWRAFNLGGNLNGIDIGSLMIDKNDMKWIIRRGGEVIVFNDNGTLDDPSDDQVKVLNKSNTSGGLAGAVNCLATDLNGTVWIGTDDGPCHMDDSRRIFTETGYTASRKEVPRNDGTNQYDYLFAGSNVLSMAADGANQMWFGLETGVYLMALERSPKEIHYFNTSNSPLLENSVTSIAIDSNGEVFFGMNQGIISYKAESAEPAPIVTDVVAYPNPVRQGYEGYIGIKGLAANSLVRITTVDGSFVTQLMSSGGQAVWDRTTVDGKRVSPGIYFIFVSTKDGQERFATKILLQD